MTDLVRAARPGDEDALYDLLMEFNRLEISSFDIEIDHDRILEHIKLGTLAKGGMHGVIDAPDVPETLAGSIGIIFSREWFAKPWHLETIWFFVRPEYRSQSLGYADALHDWARNFRKDFAERIGHDVRLLDGFYSRQRVKAKLRWWSRRGEMIAAIFLIR